MTKILLVDDEANIISLARLYLEREGYQVIAATSGQQALEEVSRLQPDLVVLDIMLPDIDGFEVCRRLRANGGIPIIMLSARREDVDRIVGLELGADDYLSKPFNPRELVARVRAVLRRSGGVEAPSVINIGNVSIDLDRHEALVNGLPVKLREKEFALLVAFTRHPRVLLSRERLLEEVWGYDFYGETRTVDVHVNRLRDRIKGAGVDIETMRGAGYRLVLAGDKT
jgi:two-component system alkaline phosphatase synthesis response regulator PhoP/two-component system response regulator ResD